MQNDPKDFKTGIEVYDYLIDECGVTIALQVANQYGGIRKFIPANMTDKTKMIKEIGEKATKALINWRGGEVYDFPLWGISTYAKLHKKIRDISLRDDLTDNQKAKLAGVTRRTILAHKAKEKEEKQPDLFD